MSRKYVEPPTPIKTVLDAALAAVSADDRFFAVPNGRIEVGWRQPAPARNGEGARPARYFVSFECQFKPAPAAAPPSEPQPE